MSHSNIANWTRTDYERAAQEYLRNLPQSHFMEATPQGLQRKITLESFDVLRVHLPDVQMVNELLLQYPKNGDLGQVCPDNMVIRSETELPHMGSFNLPFEEVRPFCVLEFVSPSSARKDYVDSFHKYEHDLHVPYYLVYYPERRDLQLFKHNGVNYSRVEPNSHGRLPIAELELEVGVLGEWARFWYRGQLLPLPADLVHQIEQERKRADEAEKQAADERKRADEARRHADEAEKRAEAGRKLAEDEKKRAEDEKKRAEDERRRAEDERKRAEDEKQRAEDEMKRAEDEKKRADDLEVELVRLRALLAQRQGPETPGTG